MTTRPVLLRDAETLLGEAPSHHRVLAGGDLSDVLLLSFASGRQAAAKGGPDPRAEAAMLEALRRAGAPAPRVLGASAHVLAMEALPNGGGLSAEGWRELGSVLARLRDDAGDAYGWPVDYAFGEVPIPGASCPDWPAFWAERRLLPEAPRLPRDLARRIEALAARLPALLPARPPASLLHGDLWSGNILAHHGRLSGLIDPACCRGHAEVDLAMLHLFGAPSPALRETLGLPEPGEAARRPVYQLWPAIVHLRLFGAGYAPLVDRLLREVGG